MIVYLELLDIGQRNCHLLALQTIKRSPMSIGRVKLVVITTKRSLMENVGPNGELNNDRMVQALLTLKNTPDANYPLL